MTATVIQGDARNLPLEDSSVDLCITSPPYYQLRDYRSHGQSLDGQLGRESSYKDYLENLWTVMRECMRVLKPQGSIFWNIGDKWSGSGGNNTNSAEGVSRFDTPEVKPKSLIGLPWRFAIGCIDDLGLILRQEIIWSKLSALPESVRDRTRRTHEQVFHFTKQGAYYSAIDEIRRAHAQVSIQRSQVHRADTIAHEDTHVIQSVQMVNPLGSLPPSVWELSNDPLMVPDAVKKRYGLSDHFAAFPQELVRRIILGWSPPWICTQCGEGRRPVLERKTTGHDNNERAKVMGRDISGSAISSADWSAIKEQFPDRITGYGCRCGEWGVALPGGSAAPPAHLAVVLDPFLGSGTTLGVARTLGRDAIGVELSASYCDLARWRIFQSGHFRKSDQRTWGERQGVLFG